MEYAEEKIRWGISQCDILKISDDEIFFLTGTEDIKEGIRMILDQYSVPFVCATMGKSGSMAFFDGQVVEADPFLRKDTIETTGAGDTFCGCSINGVLKYGLDNLDEAKLKEILTYANAGAALITMKKGAIRSMPEPENIKELIGK